MAECCRTIVLTPNAMPIRYDVWSTIIRYDLHITSKDFNSSMVKALGRYDKEYKKDGRFIYRHETGHFFIGFNISGRFWQVVK